MNTTPNSLIHGAKFLCSQISRLNPTQRHLHAYIHRVSVDTYAGKHLSTFTRGQDLLADSLAFGERKKIILDSYSPTGFDVLGILPKVDSDTEGESNEVLHMNGSIIAFPHACFLWNVSKPKDVTLESLSIVLMHNPSLEYLFIGSDKPLPPRELNRIRKELKEKNVVVEQLDITNSMGTFNILNGEDRRVAAALLIDVDDP